MKKPLLFAIIFGSFLLVFLIAYTVWYLKNNLYFIKRKDRYRIRMKTSSRYFIVYLLTMTLPVSLMFTGDAEYGSAAIAYAVVCGMVGVGNAWEHFRIKNEELTDKLERANGEVERLKSLGEYCVELEREIARLNRELQEKQECEEERDANV